MSNNINSIYRIHKLVSNIPAVQQNTQVSEVWAQIFELNESNPNKKSAAVAERLGWALRELDLARLELLSTGHPESLYENAINHLEHAFSPMLLSNTWNSVQQYLVAQTLQTLAIYSQVVPNEEELIKEDDLNELYARISELEDFLKKSELPSRLQSLIQRHINLIKQALAEYPIAGARALLEARRAAYGEFFEITAFENAKNGSESWGKLEKIWELANKAIDGAIKVDAAIQIADKVSTLIKFLPK